MNGMNEGTPKSEYTNEQLHKDTEIDITSKILKQSLHTPV